MNRAHMFWLATLAGVLAFGVGAAGGADSLSVQLVSQTSTTITLGWTPQAGYGYLYFQDCVTIDTGCTLVSRTNNASASTVKFSKGHNIYKVSVITEGNRGTYTTATPPPPPPPAGAVTQTIVNGSTIPDIRNWRAVYDANGDGIEDDPGSIRFLVDGTQILSEDNAPFGDTFATGSPSVAAGTHTFRVDAVNTAGTVVATNTVTATVATAPPPPPAQCADGIDNDADGLIDLADPGCSSSSDNDETNAPPPPPTGFPDASNTGVPAGTTLTAYTGPSTITTANTVIDSKTIGCITIATTGVIIRNSRIAGACGYAVVNIDDRTSSTMMVTIEDSEIVCTGNTGGTNGVGESDMTLRRVEITGCENGGDLNQNFVIEDSYIHNLYNSGGAHADGFQCGGGYWTGTAWGNGARNLTWRHNTIFGQGPPNDSSFGTSSIICGLAGNTNIIIDNNLLGGGSYTVYCVGDAQNPPRGINFQLTNNHFTTRFKSSVGFYGPSDGCSDEILSGNVYDETGLPIQLD